MVIGGLKIAQDHFGSWFLTRQLPKPQRTNHTFHTRICGLFWGNVSSHTKKCHRTCFCHDVYGFLCHNRTTNIFFLLRFTKSYPGLFVRIMFYILVFVVIRFCKFDKLVTSTEKLPPTELLVGLMGGVPISLRTVPPPARCFGEQSSKHRSLLQFLPPGFGTDLAYRL